MVNYTQKENKYSCSSQEYLSWVGIEPTTSVLAVRVSNHWTIRPVNVLTSDQNKLTKYRDDNEKAKLIFVRILKKKKTDDLKNFSFFEVS